MVTAGSGSQPKLVVARRNSETMLALVIVVPAIVDVFRAFFDSLWQALPEGKA